MKTARRPVKLIIGSTVIGLLIVFVYWACDLPPDDWSSSVPDSGIFDDDDQDTSADSDIDTDVDGDTDSDSDSDSDSDTDTDADTDSGSDSESGGFVPYRKCMICEHDDQ